MPQEIGNDVVVGIHRDVLVVPGGRMCSCRSALMGAAPKGQQGSASGFLATGRVVGQSLSVALAGAVFASLGGAAAGRALATNNNLSAAEIAALQQIFSHGFQITFIVCASIAAVGIFTSLVRGKEKFENR